MYSTQELIEKIENHIQGSRELDRELAIEDGYFIIDRGDNEPFAMELNGPALNYTTSIDAALQLVPDFLFVEITEMKQGKVGGHVTIYGPDAPYMSNIKIQGESHLYHPNSRTTADIRKIIPLAICSAALKARMRLK